MVRITGPSCAKSEDFGYFLATCKSLHTGVDLAYALGVCVSLCV
jgi:hypothetical protein